jgi:site-specific recombinase XerC
VATDVDGGQLGLVALPPAPALPAAAVDRLPRGELGVLELDDDPFWRLVSAFLVDCRRPQTRRAYFNDLKAWYAWCTRRELHPLSARRHDVALSARELAEQPQASGKTHAPASIARRLSCLSSFYGYAIEVNVLHENPGRKRQAPEGRQRLHERRAHT